MAIMLQTHTQTHSIVHFNFCIWRTSKPYMHNCDTLSHPSLKIELSAFICSLAAWSTAILETQLNLPLQLALYNYVLNFGMALFNSTLEYVTPIDMSAPCSLLQIRYAAYLWSSVAGSESRGQ